MPKDLDDKPVDLKDMFRSIARQADAQGFTGIAQLFSDQATKDMTPYLPKELVAERRSLLVEAESLLKQAREKLLKTGAFPALADDVEKLELRVHYEVKQER